MTVTLTALQKQRRDTAANWTAANPTLLAGELGYETDTGYWKVGDGSTAWTSLAYIEGTKISAYPLVNADIAAAAEIAVSKLANGTANQILTTDGTDVSWTDNPTIAGNLIVSGDLTVNGTTTTIDTTTLVVEDKNIELGNVTTPTDLTADGGGITLLGSTNKTISWIDATDSWTFSEHIDLASGKEFYIAGTSVLNATTLGSGVVNSSLTSVGTIATGVWQGTAIDAAYLTGVLPLAGGTMSGAIAMGTNAITGMADPSSAQDAATKNYVDTQVSGVSSNSISQGNTSVTATDTGSNGTIELTTEGTVGLTIESDQDAKFAKRVFVSSNTNTGVVSGLAYLSLNFNTTDKAFVTSYDAAGNLDKLTLDGEDIVFRTGSFATNFTFNSNGALGLGATPDYGTAGQVLTTNGSGSALTWADAASGTPDAITEGNTTVECVDTGSDGHITFDTEGSEAARFDSSGRLLVGTSSTSGNATVHVNKGSSDGTDPGGLVLTNLAAMSSIGAGDDIGYINFGASTTGAVASYDAARILCEADGTWGSGDYPTRLVFSTTADAASSPTERARITNNGSFCIMSTDTTMNTFGTIFTPASNTSTQPAVLNFSKTHSGAVDAVVFRYSGSRKGSIRFDDTSTSYNTSSDYRLKENVVNLDGAIDRVKQLAPKRFNFIVDPNKTVDGFIAHEAETVVPEAVTGVKDEVEVWQENEVLPKGVSVGDNKLDENGNTIPVPQGIDQSKLVPLLTAALQEAIAKIETLETANASLEARLTALEGGV